MRWAAICMIVMSSSAWTGADSASANVTDVFYVTSPSVEGQIPCVSNVRVTVVGQELVDGHQMVWWEMAAKLRDGAVFGVRILS